MFFSTITSVWHGLQLFWLTSGGRRCSGLIQGSDLMAMKVFTDQMFDFSICKPT
ncbi:hypothetical protein [Rhizobium mayense]|uniref:Uncharacterized protein n=1 Tax=Rhizobium mayense TaxID=1312184 RepID=A0ABT7K043_9HYPH|nr:hypothetical protein [Rhizobium mayense]MDL2401947.1 hypothetical protein [Rhizobium mayense]